MAFEAPEKRTRLLLPCSETTNGMQFLCDTIDPQGMRLSGAEFFSLDRSLLISIAGSVITYTVILVQTNDDISSRTGTSMVNTRT
ncbi:hypothetical protein MTO96_014758 [Rhipicephalus appendiculatus]